MWCLLDDHAAFSDVAVIHESKKKKKKKKTKKKKKWMCVRAGGSYRWKKQNLSKPLEKSIHKYAKSKASIQSIFCSDFLKTL